ncbi:hypothetical protein [Microbacterium sp.]|uniref:hypothetical protein n=1 Tax=Microbacterium sp. TaxID=51671 RepID=UPI0039E6465F
MNGRARAAFQLWRARNARTAGGRAYVVYAVVMVMLVIVAPLARAIWVSATSPAGIALLTSPIAPRATGFVVATLWAGALLLGRDRGPALLPPLLTHALATSELPRSGAFGPPVLRAGLLVTAITALVATVIGGGLAHHGATDLLGMAVFVAAGALVGVVTTIAWLAGQSLPRAAVPLALSLFGLGALTAVAPGALPFVPWGWAGLAYPGGGPSPAVVLLAACAAALVAAVPTLLNRLGLEELSAQAARWDSAVTHATGLELGAAAERYRMRPRLGRRIRAVRPVRPVTLRFLLRDAIGAIRTPGRLVVGVLTLGSAGALLVLALAPAAPAWLLGAGAGVLLFAGLGPLTDGIRHAVAVASGTPLYGISDERLLAGHALFPLAVVVIVLVATVVVCSIAAGVPAAAAIVSALAAGLLALAARVGNALKGPLPPSLLAPIPTPMGDLGAAARVVWALDGPMLAAAAGAAAVLAFVHPLLLVGVVVAVAAVGISRWRHRG